MAQQPPEGMDREMWWLSEVWQAFGAEVDPNYFKANVRDQMWSEVVRWAREREAEALRAYEHGRAAGYQQGRDAAEADRSD